MEKNPILNSPYEEPKLHYHTNINGELDYEQIVKGRRYFVPGINVIPTRQGIQREIFELNELADEYGSHLVNLLRKEVAAWREAKYPNTTRVTKELLNFWFNNPERYAIKKLFFAQREAVETAIFLNEIAERSNAGQNILNKLKQAQKGVSPESHQQLPRIAFKMATGTGKTVVMATLMVYPLAPHLLVKSTLKNYSARGKLCFHNVYRYRASRPPNYHQSNKSKTENHQNYNKPISDHIQSITVTSNIPVPVA